MESYLPPPENPPFCPFELVLGKKIEWQAPVLIKPAHALVSLVSSFHNYLSNLFIILFNKVAQQLNIQCIVGLI